MATLVLEDKFPATTGFVIGGDNTATPTGSGEYLIFKLGTGEGRTELSINNGTADQKWTTGETLYYEVKMTTTAGWGYGGAGKHSTVWQLKGIEDGSGGVPSPYVALELSNYGAGTGLYLMREAFGQAGSEQARILAAASLEGVEIKIGLWCLLSKTNGGKVLVKINGTKVYETASWNTLEVDSSYAFIKTGIYAASASASREMKLRDLKLYKEPEWGVVPGEEAPPEEAAPETKTKTATSVTKTTAIAKGETNPKGLATVSWFRYGTDPILSSYSVTADKSVGSGGSFAAFEQTIEGLSSNTKYYYKIGAENSAGKVFGEILNFTTQTEAKTVEIKAALARKSTTSARLETFTPPKVEVKQKSKPKTTVSAGGWVPPEGKTIAETLADGNEATKVKGKLS